MRNILRSIKSNRTLSIQILIVLLAFIVMVVLSFIFMSIIVRANLVRNANSVLDAVESRVVSRQQEFESTFGSYARELQLMIMRGDSAEQLEDYIDEIAQFTFLDSQEPSGFQKFYAYFYGYSENPLLVSSGITSSSNEVAPEQFGWYHLAVEAEGAIIQTTPQTNQWGETIYTYARCIRNDAGELLGIACMEMRINNLGQDVVSTALDQGGYGMLLNQDLVVLFHPHTPFVGMNIENDAFPLHLLASDLLEGKDVYERSVRSYRGEASVAFFRQLSNGWYLGLVAPESQYYASMSYMAVALCVLGVVLAAILIGILIHLDRARARSNDESIKKSMFLANMSHEIRTPINAIVGMTAIGKAAAAVERKDYCFSKIESASKHLLGVVNDILDISKIEANKIELSDTDFSFEMMLQQTVNMAAFYADEKRQKLLVHIDREIPCVVHADDQRLAQVITNILSNSIKFTPDEGTINLSAALLREKDGICTVEVKVSDTGIGISQEQLAKLFQPFQQAESSTTRKYGGTGLGLAISKSIVELMGGTIEVKSELGKGTTMTVTVQMRRGNAASLGRINETYEVQSSKLDALFKGHRVLFAEDIEINREMVLVLLEPTGLEIECAVNGAQALQMFSDAPGRYELILMDIQMPEMDGYEATRRIRALNLPEAEAIPIVAMTANVFKEDVESCLAAGMNGHLGKPLNMDALLETLHRYLRATPQSLEG